MSSPTPTIAIGRRKPGELTGHALIDEDFLRECGVTDFDKYACGKPGGEPMRITWQGTENVAVQSVKKAHPHPTHRNPRTYLSHFLVGEGYPVRPVAGRVSRFSSRIQLALFVADPARALLRIRSARFASHSPPASRFHHIWGGTFDNCDA